MVIIHIMAIGLQGAIHASLIVLDVQVFIIVMSAVQDYIFMMETILA